MDEPAVDPSNRLTVNDVVAMILAAYFIVTAGAIVVSFTAVPSGFHR